MYMYNIYMYVVYVYNMLQFVTKELVVYDCKCYNNTLWTHKIVHG